MQKPSSFTTKLFKQFISRFSLRSQLLMLYGVLMIALTLSISLVISNEINHSSQHQADSIGQLLSEQTASAATDMLVTGDRLSLNILLGQLVQNPYVAKASIYSIDNQRIASATAKMVDSTLGFPVYSSPIHYQDVIAGYARLSLNNDLLSQKPKDALLVIVAISLILLLVGLIILQFYSSTVAVYLRLIERQLNVILPTGNPATPTKGEVARLSAFVESQLLIRKRVEPNEQVIESSEVAVIAAIRIKNLPRLQQLIAPRDLQEILTAHNQIIINAADYYDAEVTFTPEGNAYLRFINGVAIQGGRQHRSFTSDALYCSLMIAALTEKVSAINITNTHLGIGLSISDQQPEFPEQQHPALSDSAASQALTLATADELDGIYMRKAETRWLPAGLAVLESCNDEAVRIKGINREQAGRLNDNIKVVFNKLKL